MTSRGPGSAPRRAWAIAVACALPASIAAQSAVVPPAQAAADGNALDREPFGHEAIRHLTYVHRDLLGGVPATARFWKIGYRRDASLGPGDLQRPPGIWQVRMGNHTGPVGQPSSAWPAANDPAWAVMFQPRMVSFPTLSLPAAGLPQFVVAFPLDVPFAYAGGHLGIEHFVADSTARHDYFIDAVDGFTPLGQVDVLGEGLGCPAGLNRARGQAPNPGGGDLEVYLFAGPRSASATFALGASETAWGSLPLPLDLGALGLSGCSVFASPDVLVPVRTDASGVATLRAAVPGAVPLLGARLAGQWFCFGDPRVNPGLALTTSEGLRIRLGTNLGVPFVGMSVVSAFSGSNQHGFVQSNRGPVVRLDW